MAAAVTSAQSTVGKAMREGDFAEALTQLATLRAPIDAFFEEVMVMDEDPAIRENRLKLLNRMVGVFSTVADFSLLA